MLDTVGQTRVYCNCTNKPLAHWPFRWQTAEGLKSHPKWSWMGWLKTQVSSTRFCSILVLLFSSYLAGPLSTRLFLSYSLALIGKLPLSHRNFQDDAQTIPSAQLESCDISHRSSSDGAISPFYIAISSIVRLNVTLKVQRLSLWVK